MLVPAVARTHDRAQDAPVTSAGRAWTVERFAGPASAFHARPMPEAVDRRLWVHEVDRPALVLGSSQRDDIVDMARATASGVEIVHRRSGGGAVLLVPGEVLWVDVLLPAADPLWESDVGRSAWWLGDAWARALAAVGAAVVHRGPMIRTAWSALACFAGVGSGEVVVQPAAADGLPAKLVGISQRRTRVGARFQCALYRHHDPAALPALLALDDTDRSMLTVALAVGVATADLTEVDLLGALPTRRHHGDEHRRT